MVFDPCTLIHDSVLYIGTHRNIAKLTLRVCSAQILKQALQPSGVLTAHWLLTDLWKTVAEYLTTGLFV